MACFKFVLIVSELSLLTRKKKILNFSFFPLLRCPIRFTFWFIASRQFKKRITCIYRAFLCFLRTFRRLVSQINRKKLEMIVFNWFHRRLLVAVNWGAILGIILLEYTVVVRKQFLIAFSTCHKFRFLSLAGSFLRFWIVQRSFGFYLAIPEPLIFSFLIHGVFYELKIHFFSQCLESPIQF